MKKSLLTHLYYVKKTLFWYLAPFSLVFSLHCISLFGYTSWGYAATNATGMTTSFLQAHAMDSLLTNYGTISPGQVFVSSGASAKLHGISAMYGDGNIQNFTFFNYGHINIPQNTYAARGMSAFADSGTHFLYNSGNIHVATGAGSSMYAFGMQARSYDNNAHRMVNEGAIYVTSSGQDSPAYGMETFSHYGNHSHSNTGIISVSTSGHMSSAFGMNAYTSYDGNHSMINEGHIYTSTMGDSSQAFGMDPSTGRHGNFTVINNGTIFASISGDANSYAAAMNAYTKEDGNHTFTNNGELTATAYGELSRSYGIQIFSENSGSHTVVNTASIRSLAEGDKSRAYGIRASSLFSGNHTLLNTGFIYAENISPTGLASPAHGMVADINSGSGNHTMRNKGTIIAMAHGYDIRAFGMRAAASLDGKHFLENSGTIFSTVYGTLSEAFGLAANAVTGNHTLRNEGFIRVHSADALGGAYGLYVTGVGGHVLYNRGAIGATAPKGFAYEAYGEAGYSVDTWATTLRTWTGSDAVLGAAAGQSIRLGTGSEGAHLILRPATHSQGFALGKSYEVAHMVSIGGVQQLALDQVLALGFVASASAEVDFLQATLDTTDPTRPLVSLEGHITEKTSPGAMVQQQQLTNIQGQFTTISQNVRKGILQRYWKEFATDAWQGLGAGSKSLSEHSWQAFLSPYVTAASNTHFNYNGSTVGISGGATYAVTERFSLGGHIDINASNFSANVLETHTDSTSFALGVHGVYTLLPQWYIRGQFSASFQQNSHTFSLPLASEALYADALSFGKNLYANVATGYTWRINSQHSLTPEIGISYLTSHGTGYAAQWQGIYTANGLYDLNYDESFYSALYATYNMDWRSAWALEEGSSIVLQLGLGLRQRLSTQNMNTTVRLLDTDFTTSSAEAQSTWLMDFGFEYMKDDLSVRLTYAGSYEKNQHIHGGNLVLTLTF